MKCIHGVVTNLQIPVSALSPAGPTPTSTSPYNLFTALVAPSLNPTCPLKEEWDLLGFTDGRRGSSTNTRSHRSPTCPRKYLPQSSYLYFPSCHTWPPRRKEGQERSLLISLLPID